MKTVDKIAKEVIERYIKFRVEDISTNHETMYVSNAIRACVESIQVSQQWISVEEEIECNINIDGIMYSESVLLKVKDFDFPLVGAYMKANDDEFWEIYGSFEVKQSDITHYRPIELI
jgi:hypothetical protein